MSLDMLADAVAAIIEAADEVKKEGIRDDLHFGQLLAYSEALCILRDACDPDVLAEVGLDFDIDARYLVEK